MNLLFRYNYLGIKTISQFMTSEICPLFSGKKKDSLERSRFHSPLMRYCYYKKSKILKWTFPKWSSTTESILIKNQQGLHRCAPHNPSRRHIRFIILLHSILLSNEPITPWQPFPWHRITIKGTIHIDPWYLIDIETRRGRYSKGFLGSPFKCIDTTKSHSKNKEATGQYAPENEVASIDNKDCGLVEPDFGFGVDLSVCTVAFVVAEVVA